MRVACRLILVVFTLGASIWLIASKMSESTANDWIVLEEVATYLHRDCVDGVAFSFDGKVLVTGSEGESVVLWDVATGSKRVIPNTHANKIQSLVVSPDCRTLATVAHDATVNLWDITSWKVRVSLFGGNIAFTPDSATVAVGRNGFPIKLFRVASGEHVADFPGRAHTQECLAFSPDGKTLAEAGWDQRIKMWDVGTKRIKATFDNRRGLVSGAMKTITFNPDGQRLVSGSDDGQIEIWDVVTGKLRANWAGHEDWILCVAFSPDGKTLASAGMDDKVILWDATSRRKKASADTHTRPVTSVAFSPDGRYLASGSLDKTVKVWKVLPSK